MNNKKTYNLTSKSFAEIFSEREDNLPLIVRNFIMKTNFKYKIVEGKEY